jgi:hypothetical protein
LLFIEEELNPQDETKGSSPSPGAHLEEISTCFKAHDSKREAVVGLEERGLQINAGKTPDVVAVDEEEQEEAKKLDYESLDRLIDSQYLGIFLGNGSGQG